MPKTFQHLFLLFLLCAVNFAAAGTVTSIDDLKPGKDGVYTIQESAVYLISAAGSTGVTKEYTLTTSGVARNVALQVNLGLENNTIILVLMKYSSAVEGLQDADGNYVPALKVLGKGTLIIRHKETSNASILQVKDLSKGEQPTVDLSGMTGGEVRFERAAGESGSMPIGLQRVWAVSDAATSSGSKPAPTVIGNTKVRLTFANNACVRFQASPCVVKSKELYVLPELISVGYAAMRIEEGAVVRVRKYYASESANKAGYTWTMQPLFPAAITLAGGSLELDSSKGSDAPGYIEIPKTKVNEVIAAAKCQGVAFGMKVLTVSKKLGVVPASCVKVADGQDLDEKERTTDEKGRLVIVATKSPELVYAPSETESEKSAVTLFDLVPTVTANGCAVDSCFGIAEFKVNQVINSDLASTLKISVDLPTETAQSRSFYLRVLQTSPGGVTSTIYPAFPTTFATLTTFTRDAADSIRFSASVPCRITPSLGTTAITIRAYATPPAK